MHKSNRMLKRAIRPRMGESGFIRLNRTKVPCGDSRTELVMPSSGRILRPCCPNENEAQSIALREGTTIEFLGIRADWRTRSNAPRSTFVAGFQTRRPREFRRPADLEVGDTALGDLCASSASSALKFHRAAAKKREMFLRDSRSSNLISIVLGFVRAFHRHP